MQKKQRQREEKVKGFVMKKVRITVIRKVCHKDLMAKYENPVEHACGNGVESAFHTG